jgi:hypothetical protein
MLPTQTAPMPMSPASGEPAPRFMEDPALNEAVKAQIIHFMKRHEPPERIAALVESNFQVAVSLEQMLACWNARNTPATRTGPGQEKESMPIPKAVVTDPVSQRKAAANPPEPIAAANPANAPAKDDPAPVIAGASDQDAATNRTGPGQVDEPAVILPTEVREFIIARMARGERPLWIAKEVRLEFGFVVDRDEIIVCWRDRDSLPTRTGPGPEKESSPRLDDEVKEFIVKGIACYETPSRIAAAVRINFGIDIDRRRIFDYNPAGSRPPAQRWIDLHAAERARFLRDKAEIGIAQQVIRLRMLDRFAQMAEDDNQYDRAAKYLQQAARECGGFYEKQAAPRATSPRSTAPGSSGGSGGDGPA